MEATPAASILLVDDRPENRLALEAALSGLGHQLVHASSGREALRKVLEREFAVILLDVQMPEMDGFETANLIRSRERARTTPIIFITAIYSTEDSIARGYAAGAADYIVKPCSAELLRSKVEAWTGIANETHRLRADLDDLRSQCANLEHSLTAAQGRLDGATSAFRQQQLDCLAILGHEIRNPLAAILLGASLLRQRAPAQAACQHDCAVIERNARCLAQLVDSLEEAAAVTASDIRLQRDTVDLSAQACAALEEVRPLADAKSHRIELRNAAGPLRVNGDSERLRQLITHLLNNAVKYTGSGGVIRLSLDHETEADPAGGVREWAVVSVQDNGSGLPTDGHAHLFEPFVQGERGLDRSEGGLGLGLAVAKRLAELHDGDLTATSEGPGQGSRFTLRLPLTEAAVAGQ